MSVASNDGSDEAGAGKPLDNDKPQLEDIGEAATLLPSEDAESMRDLPMPKLDGLGDVADRDQVFEALFGVPAQPRLLGRYVVQGTLGEGGMGIVLKGFDPELDRRVAIKVLHHEVDEKQTVRLRREAQAMAKLSHPNVVQVHEVGRIDGQTFVAMELVRGQTLRDWMRQQPPPSWRRCVELFIQVGEGLAAAHEAGLVHRDFKPGNAMVDEKGRARVLDFGLARQLETLDDTGRSDDAGMVAKESGETTALKAPLTRTGTVLGTPAYMPLEQLKGQRADARSDQFSFCVSLWEAVYGERPFSGTSLAARAVMIQHGDVTSPPRSTKVPLALRKILIRGLGAEPDQRWRSMAVLLGELRRVIAPRSLRRTIVATVGGGLVAVAGVQGANAYFERLERCTGARAQLAGVWDDDRRQQLQDAIIGTELVYAEDTWQAVQSRLNDYANTWVDKHTEVCKATAVKHEQSEADRSLRMKCLRGRKAALNATVTVLARAGTSAVEKAVAATEDLPGLWLCDELDYLQELEQAVPPPEDPEVTREVEDLRKQLDDVQVLHNIDSYEQALTTADQVVDRAEVLGYMPLVAEAKYWRGDLLSHVARHEEAERDLTDAYELAIEHGRDTIALDSADKLVSVIANQRERFAESLQWGRTSLSFAKRFGWVTIKAKSLSTIGSVLRRQGKYDEAEVLFKQALQQNEQFSGDNDLAVASNLSSLGAVLDQQGKYEESEALHRQALETREARLGSLHPQVAESVSSLGILLSRQGNYVESEAQHRRAMQIYRELFGENSLQVADRAHDLGAVLANQGRYEEAELQLWRSLRIYETALGTDHPKVAWSLDALANELTRQGKYEEAEAMRRRSLRIREVAQGPSHPIVAKSLQLLASSLSRRGEYEESETLARRALEIQEKTLGANHPSLASSLGALAHALYKQGKYEDAEALYRRSLQIQEIALGADHPGLAANANNLAYMLLELERYDEAEILLQRSLRIFDAASDPRAAYPLVGLAISALEQRNPEGARKYAERAVGIRTSVGASPSAIAEANFLLARALWADRAQRHRARHLAELARDTFATQNQSREDELIEAETWLAEHRVR